MKSNNAATTYLLSRFLVTEYQQQFLARISTKTFDQLKEDLTERFNYLELTDTDIKEAWKEYFEYSISCGSLISPDFCITDPVVDYRHDELKVHDYMLDIASKAIDSLYNEGMTAADYIAKEERMVKECKEVMTVLEHCAEHPDADISITVKHTDGTYATANLYDLASLVEDIWLALEEFIKETE